MSNSQKKNDPPPPLASKSLLNLSTWGEFFTGIPCVSQSLMTGVGMAGIMMLHRRRVSPKDLNSALNWSMSTFVFGSTLSFMFCANSTNARIKDQRMMAEMERELARKRNASESAPSSSLPGGVGQSPRA